MLHLHRSYAAVRSIKAAVILSVAFVLPSSAQSTQFLVTGHFDDPAMQGVATVAPAAILVNTGWDEDRFTVQYEVPLTANTDPVALVAGEFADMGLDYDELLLLKSNGMTGAVELDVFVNDSLMPFPANFIFVSTVPVNNALNPHDLQIADVTGDGLNDALVVDDRTLYLFVNTGVATSPFQAPAAAIFRIACSLPGCIESQQQTMTAMGSRRSSFSERTVRRGTTIKE